MSSDFDFGNFLDLKNQVILKINCIKLFQYLCNPNKNQKDISLIRDNILEDPISKSFSGFFDVIQNLKLDNKDSILRAFPHLNLMIKTLNDNGEADAEILGTKQKLKENLSDSYIRIMDKDDIWVISQIHEFLESESDLATILTRILDLEVSDMGIISEVRDLLENKNSLAGLEALLKKLLSNEDRGFITGEKRGILLDRGVKESFVNLITKESLKDLTPQNLLEDKLFLISFTEEMLNDKPDFIERITENGVILTSTGAESKDGFVFLVLSKNEMRNSFFENYDQSITEVI